MNQETVLRKIRIKSGETISSMAKFLDMRPSRYYMIEVGERPATPQLAEKIASLLKVKVDNIFLPQSFTARKTTEYISKPSESQAG